MRCANKRLLNKNNKNKIMIKKLGNYEFEKRSLWYTDKN